MTPATALGMAISFVALAPFAHPGVLSALDWTMLAALGAGQIGLGMILFTAGARLIAAAQAGLITLLEVVLGPLWMWLIYREQPDGADARRRHGDPRARCCVHAVADLRPAALTARPDPVTQRLRQASRRSSQLPASCPASLRGIEVLHVPAADQLDVDGVAAAGVRPAELDRDVPVGVAVHEQHVDVGRLVDRRGRTLLEQPLHRARAGAESRRERQVADAAPAPALRARARGWRPAGRGALRRCGLRVRRARGRSPAAARVAAATTSSSGAGQSPPQSSLRYSTFQTARPRAARSAATRSSRSRPYCARQQPPCTSTTPGVRAGAAGQPEVGHLLGVRAVADRRPRASRLSAPATARAAPWRRASSRGSWSTAAPARAGSRRARARRR